MPYTKEVGTIIPLTIPFYEKDLINDIDDLRHLELCNSRSHYFRKLVKREKESNKHQLQQMKSMREQVR